VLGGTGYARPVPTEIDRRELEPLIGEGAQLVEVLPRDEYEDLHLPGALNMPLKELLARSAVLDAGKPVVVYCWDSA